MEWIEVTGRTLEEAVERALDSLGVHETELDYEVLTEPKTTLLGLRRTEARIRARVKPRSREKPNDKRRRQRDDQRGRRRSSRERGGGGGADRQRSAPSGAPKAGNTPKAQPAASGGGNGNGNSNRQADDAAPRGEGGSSPSGSRRRRRGSGGGQQTNAANGAARDTSVDAAPAANHEERDEMERSGSIEEQVSAGREFATGLLVAFDAQGTVSVDPEDNEIEVSIVGDNLGLLVGPKGATLAALEELLRGAVGHRGPGRLHLDVAGYRAKRRAALAEFAGRVADDVRAQGAAKALEPMSAPDRKVVHDTVAELDGVATISDGEEPRRRVIIQPA